MAALLTALFGVSGALFYGAADFFGGLSSRRLGALRAAGIAALAGLVVLLAAFPLFGGRLSGAALFFGALSGVAGAVALSLLYACLALGPMSVLSPITALVAAVVPMTWGLVLGERIGLLGSIGVVVALVAVLLVAFVPERTTVRATPRGILMAVGSGAMIGVFLTLIDATPEDSGLVPLLANRMVNAALMFAAVGILALRRPRRERSIDPRGSRLALLCGALDGTANALLLAGVRTGDLTVMAVLVALYPAGTIVLAGLVLHERVTRLQGVGLGLALVAAAMLAVG